MPSFMSLALARRFGVYEVGALIGTGRMGKVYRAPNARLKREAALNILRETFGTDAERLAPPSSRITASTG